MNTNPVFNGQFATYAHNSGAVKEQEREADRKKKPIEAQKPTPFGEILLKKIDNTKEIYESSNINIALEETKDSFQEGMLEIIAGKNSTKLNNSPKETSRQEIIKESYLGKYFDSYA